jgi:hypothetical protein
VIRRATAEDIPAIVAMGKRFHGRAGLPGEYDTVATGHFIEILCQRGVVLIGDRAMIGGMMVPSYCAPAWWQAVELFWWSESRDGIRLLDAFEAWARENGADEVRMSSIERFRGDRIGRLLAKRGYAVTEVSYGKAVR